jgi:hypothetical protein
MCAGGGSEDAGGEEAGAHSTTPTYTAGKDIPAREPSWSAFCLQKPSILACMCEGGGRGGGRQAGAPSDQGPRARGRPSAHVAAPIDRQLDRKVNK